MIKTQVLITSLVMYSGLAKFTRIRFDLMHSLLSSRQLSTPSRYSKYSKLQHLRELMAHEKIDAYVIPSSDPHMSEDVAPIHSRRKFISGFTGSAGTAVITKDNAYMWTDGR
jgi:hypothetical protein